MRVQHNYETTSPQLLEKYPEPARVVAKALARISHQAACRRQKLLGFTSLTAMSMIVPMADCAGRALAGLLAP